MSTEEQIFKLVAERGEFDGDGIHVLANDSEEGFRIYHATGYCFNVEREYAGDDDAEGVGPDGYIYTVTTSFEGFKEVTTEQSCKLIQSWLK